MIDYKSCIETVILRGAFVLSEMEDKINKLWVEGKLTDADRESLLPMAAEYADDVFQTNVLERLTKVEHDIWEILHPVDVYEIWHTGKTTKQHEIVRFDVTGDGELDLCQYNGGRQYTSLSIGKIEGWNMLDRELNVTHTITRDADGGYVVTPIPEPTPEPEADSEALAADDGTDGQAPDETTSESTTEGEGA